MVIDSGSNCNILDDETWENFKRKGVEVKHQNENPEEAFTANNKQLKVNVSFHAIIKVGSKQCFANFYMIKNGSGCLLGKKTAVQLNATRDGG